MVNSKPEGKAPQVLVVEDDRPLVEVLECNLQAVGYRVLSAYDGETALALLC